MKREYMSYEEYLVNVKKGIVTRDGNCPVTPLLLMLQGRWKAQLMYEMCIYDTVRFGQLRKDLPGITNTMLTKALRELEEDGLISRKQFNEIPPHVEYSLTDGPRSSPRLLCDHELGLSARKGALRRAGSSVSGGAAA